jgi:hypothetical protein
MATTVTAGLLDKDLLKAQARQRLRFQEENAKALLAQQEEDEAIRREMQMSNSNQLTEQLNLALPNQFDQAAMERGAPINEGYQIEVDGQSRGYNFDNPLAQSGMEAFREREGITADPTKALSRAMSNQVAATQQVTPDDKAKELNQWSQKWLGRVKTRKAILGAFSAAFGGKNLAKEYEANAIAKYTDYVNNQAGLIALEGGNVDASVGIARFLKAGGDLDQALDLFGQPGVAAKAPSHKTHFAMRDGKSMKISSDWINGEWIETGAVPQTVAETNIDIKMPGSGSQTEIAKSFGKSFGALLADEERFFMPIQAESAQLPILINAIQSGQVDTGKLASFALPFKQVFSSFLGSSEAQRLFDDRLGATEWFNAVVDSFIGTKLKMTKGSISEKEMAIFQRMIPSLSLTDEGNIRLLNMMHALNRIALHSYKGAIDYSKWIDTQEGGIGGKTGNQNFIELKKHQEDERKRAVRFLNYLANAPVNTNGPAIPLQRAEAFLQLRNANQSNVTDKQINEQLDKWGYPRG